MGRRAARDRPAFTGQRTVTVRCGGCGARLAEAWPTSGGSGWDGVVFAGDGELHPIGRECWRCQRCGRPYTVEDSTLRGLLTGARSASVTLTVNPP